MNLSFFYASYIQCNEAHIWVFIEFFCGQVRCCAWNFSMWEKMSLFLFIKFIFIYFYSFNDMFFTRLYVLRKIIYGMEHQGLNWWQIQFFFCNSFSQKWFYSLNCIGFWFGSIVSFVLYDMFLNISKKTMYGVSDMEKDFRKKKL